MLASPGHSPRHIEPPSPSPSLQSVENALAIRSSTSGMVVPPPAKKAKKSQAVLDEDSWVAAIEKIIERDYFPDIPKLQNKLEWLEASRSGDPVLMREAQLNIIQRLKALKGGVTPMINQDNFATPSTVLSAAPSPGFMAPSVAGDISTGQIMVDENGIPIDTSVSLDKFMRRYTSEDNASFSKIIDKVNKRKREKYMFLENSSQPLRIKTGDDDRQTDGYGTSNQPLSTLDPWGYTTKNLLMYDAAEREDAPLTVAEKEAKLHGPPKSINIQSTRFHEKMFGAKLPEEDTISIMYTPVRGATPVDSDSRKRYDLEELRKMGEHPKTAGTAGYNYVRTPSPAPGVDASPFVTWGEIEGTPLRLEMEDTPVGIGGSGDGPHFKIPAPPVRDARAHTLSREASRNIRKRSSRFRQPPRTPLSCASPARGSLTPGLSEAAQRFMNKAIAKSCASVDAKLRASYGASTTPGTPRMARNAVRTREGSVPRDASVLRSPSPSPFRQPNI